MAASRSIAPSRLAGRGRKVRTAQSNAPVKSRVLPRQEQTVPQKITAIVGAAGEEFFRQLRQVRVKT